MEKITENLAVYLALLNSLAMALGAFLGWISKSLKEKSEEKRANRKAEVDLAASYEQLATNAVTRLVELQEKIDGLQGAVYTMECKIQEREKVIRILVRQIEESGGTPKYNIEELAEERNKQDGN